MIKDLVLNYDLPVVVILLPLFAAMLIPVLGLISRSLVRVAVLFSTGGAFLSSLILVKYVFTHGTVHYFMGGWPPPIGIEYVLDPLSVFVLAIVTCFAFAVAIYAPPSLEKEIPSDKTVTFWSVYLLFITGLMGIVLTGDIFNLYVFIEISSLAGYGLVAIGKNRKALMASFNYVILGTVAATFILIGIGYLYMQTGTLNMADLHQKLAAHYDSRLVRTAFAFFTVGLSLKLALFPLHTWLPGAYTWSPSPVGALMAAITTKVGAYALFRITFSVFSPEFITEHLPVDGMLIVISSIAIISGSAIALRQTNIKKMLAYSSVGQIGYIVLGAVLVNQTAATGGILHLLNHALMKGALFLVAGCVVYRVGRTDIAAYSGLGRKMPITMAAFTIAGLSMIGVPLTVGFVSKWYIVVGAIQAGSAWIVAVILVSSLMTAGYFWRIIEHIYFHPPVSETGLAVEPGATTAATVREAPLQMALPAFVLALLCLVFGTFAEVPIILAAKAAAALLGGL